MRVWVYGRMRVWALSFVMLLCAQPLMAQKHATTVILVRHSEKEAEPKADPPLSAAGRARTMAFLDVIRNAGVEVIYSTPKLRNLQTAQPLGDSLHIPVVLVPIEGGKIDDFARDIVERVRKDDARVYLVVGHSNTFGPVIKAFGGPDIGEIADPDYSNVMILTVEKGKTTRLIRGHFGK